MTLAGKFEAAAVAIEPIETSGPQDGPGPGAPAAASAAAAAGPAPIDYNADAAELVEMAVGSLVPLYPRLEGLYTPHQQARISGALGRVMAKYEISMDWLLGQWLPEIMLATVLIPVGAKTYTIIREDNALVKQGGKPKPAEPSAAPSPPTGVSPPPAPAGAAAPADVTVPKAVEGIGKVGTVDAALLFTKA